MASLKRQDSITSMMNLSGEKNPVEDKDKDIYEELSSMYLSKTLISIFCFLSPEIQENMMSRIMNVVNKQRTSNRVIDKKYCITEKTNVQKSEIDDLLQKIITTSFNIWGQGPFYLWEFMIQSNMMRNKYVRYAFENKSYAFENKSYVGLHPIYNPPDYDELDALNVQDAYNKVFDLAPLPNDELIVYRCWGDLPMKDLLFNPEGFPLFQEGFPLNQETSVTVLHSYASLTWCEDSFQKNIDRKQNYPKSPNEINSTTLIRIPKGCRGVINLSMPGEEANSGVIKATKNNRFAQSKKGQYEMILDPRGSLYPTYQKVEPKSLSSIHDNTVYYDEFIYEPIPLLSKKTVYNSSVFNDDLLAVENGNMSYKSLTHSLCCKGNYTEAIFANFGRGTFHTLDKDGRKQEINGFILKKENKMWHVEKDDTGDVGTSANTNTDISAATGANTSKYIYILSEDSLLEFDDYYKNEDGRFIKKHESIYQSYITQEKLASNMRNMKVSKRGKYNFKKHLIEKEMLIKASGEALTDIAELRSQTVFLGDIQVPAKKKKRTMRNFFKRGGIRRKEKKSRKQKTIKKTKNNQENKKQSRKQSRKQSNKNKNS